MTVAEKIDKIVAHRATFICFLVACVVGPMINLDATNYSISVITASMLFLGNDARRRSERAIHTKLDALVISDDKTDDALARIEDLAEDEIEAKRNGP